MRGHTFWGASSNGSLTPDKWTVSLDQADLHRLSALALALAQQATHLLLHEPTNHLDVGYQHVVLELFRDRLLLLDQGQVVASGTPSEVLVRENIEPVHQSGVSLVEHHDGFQLVFRPLPRQGPPQSTTSGSQPAGSGRQPTDRPPFQ